MMNNLDNEVFYGKTVERLDKAIGLMVLLSDVDLFNIDTDKHDNCLSYLHELKEQAELKAILLKEEHIVCIDDGDLPF